MSQHTVQSATKMKSSAAKGSAVKSSAAKSKKRDQNEATLRDRASLIKKSTKRTPGPPARAGGSDGGLERAMLQLMNQKINASKELLVEKKKKLVDKGLQMAEKIAHLSNLFKQVSDNLGCRVKAASTCEEFVQFLDADEYESLTIHRESIKIAKSSNIFNINN